MRIKILFFGTVSTIACLLFFSGCAENKTVKDKVVATVNGEPIFVKDFKRAVELKLKRDPMFRVTPETLKNVINVLIDKKLLIQQAREEKLDQTKRFIDTIQTFWEQTLIRDLLSLKDKDIGKNIATNGKEVLDLYEKISHQKTFQVMKSPDKIFITELLKAKPESIEWEETIGPVGYEDISSPLLRRAFNLKKGETLILKEADTYYLFYLAKDTAISVPPLSEMRDKITQKILKRKKRQLCKEWLNSVKNTSDISVNDNILKGVSYTNE